MSEDRLDSENAVTKAEVGTMPVKPTEYSTNSVDCIESPRIKRRQELTLAHFNHIEQQVALATTTAGLIVAADAVLIAAVLDAAERLDVFKNPSQMMLFLVALVLIAAGLLAALLAALPSIRFSSRGASPPVENLFFFGRIAVHDFEDYYQALHSLTEEMLDRELAYQIFGKAKWLRKMFVRTRVAILLTSLGAMAAIFILIWSVTSKL